VDDKLVATYLDRRFYADPLAFQEFVEDIEERVAALVRGAQ
jgi:hypothetical protein